mmetsp:Transcript_10294/g.22275  ORF Transcript_10294/g.22275 Transcript_10294/m.22275 type:complete len:107 (+) Transcript_10294:511-831(+)
MHPAAIEYQPLSAMPRDENALSLVQKYHIVPFQCEQMQSIIYHPRCCTKECARSSKMMPGEDVSIPTCVYVCWCLSTSPLGSRSLTNFGTVSTHELVCKSQFDDDM